MLNFKTKESKESKIFSQKADIETSSDDYAKRFSGETGKYFLSIQEKITLDLLKPWPRAKVLDVGGGHAQLAIPLVKNGFEVTVVGSDESCRTRLDKFLYPMSFGFLTCNLLSLPFDNNSFDVVIAFRLLTHEDNWKIQIAELSRVAKHAVIVDYPDIRSFNILYDFLFSLKQKFEKNTRTYKNFSRKEIIEEFKKNNFTIPKIKPEFFFPMIIHRVIKKVPLSKNIENFLGVTGLTKLFGSPVILRMEAKENNN